ncbi:MAG: hypothetical protein JO232_22400 [Verrucomicrobia bacterium]|nr:hypothetical protein [Verrucomicrobiota bacterium]
MLLRHITHKLRHGLPALVAGTKRGADICTAHHLDLDQTEQPTRTAARNNKISPNWLDLILPHAKLAQL